jgi:hypothetical protein
LPQSHTRPLLTFWGAFESAVIVVLANKPFQGATHKLFFCFKIIVSQREGLFLTASRPAQKAHYRISRAAQITPFACRFQSRTRYLPRKNFNLYGRKTPCASTVPKTTNRPKWRSSGW